MGELMTEKNQAISSLEMEVSKLQEMTAKSEAEQKENESLEQQLSANKNANNEEVEKLSDRIIELEQSLSKMEKEKQRKIEKLEADLAERDDALLNISKTVGTEFAHSEEIDVEQWGRR